MLNVARNVAFLIVLLFAATASAQTPWCANITGDTIWSLAQSPIHVTCDITIGGPATPVLTIEPGVEVICDPEVQITVGYSLNFNDYGGAIQALGTSEAPILFSSASGEIGDWEGIYYSNESSVGGAVSSFQHCVIQNAGQAVNSYNLFFNNTTNVTLSDCRILNSSGTGVYVYQGSVLLERCEITDNVAHGANGGTLTECLIARNGGYGVVNSGTLTDCTVTENTLAGLYGTSFSMTGTTVSDNGGPPVQFTSPNLSATFSNNTFSGNTPEAFVVAGGRITDCTWPNGGLPYHVMGDIEVYNSDTTPAIWTLEPGVELYFASDMGVTFGHYYNWQNYGAGLQAPGTAAEPILFTSLSGEIGGWTGLYFTAYCNVDGAISDLQHCTIEKAGSGTFAANVYFYKASSITLSDCYLRQSSTSGVRSVNSSVVLERCEITDNTDRGARGGTLNNCLIARNGGYGVSENGTLTDCTVTENTLAGLYGTSFSMTGTTVSDNGGPPVQFTSPNLSATFSNNTFSGNTPEAFVVAGGRITGCTWPNGGLPYHVMGDIEVYNSDTTPAIWTLEPGVELYFASDMGVTFGHYYNWQNYGAGLQAPGTAAEPILFTSLSGEIGGWTGLYFSAHCEVDGAMSDLQHCTIEKAGSGTFAANVYFATTSAVNLTNCIVRRSSNHGVRLSGSAIEIQYCTIIENEADNVYFVAGLDGTEISHSILAYSSSGAGIRGDGVLPTWFTCNDVWNNGEGDYVGFEDATGLRGNISTDPLFVDRLGNDLRLQEESPCAPENNHCGLMGAYAPDGGSGYLVLLSPPDNATIEDQITLSWEAVPSALNYQYVVCDSEDLSGVIATEIVPGPQADFQPGSAFHENQVYYWSARALFDASYGYWAPPRRIQREGAQVVLDTPELISPVGAMDVALPDVFSWRVESSYAVSFDVEIATDPEFTDAVWTSRGDESRSQMVPSDPFTAPGATYYWRVKAIGAGIESEWSSVGTFVHQTTGTLPAVPTLVSPANGAPQPGPTVDYTWEPAGNATSYVLTVSAYADFREGRATISTPLYQLHDTTAAPDLGYREATTLYWKINGVNATGIGPDSDVRQFEYDRPVAPLASASIVTPPQGQIIEQGSHTVCSALVAGDHDGPVTVQWMVDGNAFNEQVFAMPGRGFRTPPVGLPILDDGDHDVTCSIIGPGSVTSPAATITLIPQQWGPPARLALSAQETSVRPGDSVTMTCRVLDIENLVVADDPARDVSIELTGNGSVSAATLQVENGVGTFTFTAGVNSEPPIISVSSNGLAGAAVAIEVSDTELDRLRGEAYAYMDRLENLKWDAYSAEIPIPSDWSFDVTAARTFVDGAPEGYEQRLRRLNLYLRALDRAFYYDPNQHTHGTEEPGGRIPGIQMLLDRGVKGFGDILLMAGETFNKFRSKEGTNWAIRAVAKEYEKTFLVAADALVKLELRLLGDNSYANEIKEVWSVTKTGITQLLKNNKDLTLIGLLQSNLTRTLITIPLAKTMYIDPLEKDLEEFVAALGQPDWYGGSDEGVEEWTECHIQQVRFASDMYVDHINGVFGAVEDLAILHHVADVLEETPTMGGWIRASNALNRTIESAYILGASVDCIYGAYRIAGYEYAGVVHEALLMEWPLSPGYDCQNYGKTAAVVKAATGSSGLLAPELLKAAQGEYDVSWGACESAFATLEYVLNQSSVAEIASVTAACDSIALDVFGDHVHFEGMVAATADSALVMRPETYSRLSELSDASRACRQAFGTATLYARAWAVDTSDPSLRLLALDATQEAITAGRDYNAAIVAYLTEMMDVPARACLVVEEIESPYELGLNATAEIRALIGNYGAVPAGDVRVSIAADSTSIEVTGPVEVLLGTLEPGESVECVWDLRMLLHQSHPDSTDVILGSIRLHATDAVAEDATFMIGTAAWVSGVPDREEAPMAVHLGRNVPNPFNPSTRIEFSVAQAGHVRLDVFDTRGHLVATLVDEPRPAGQYEVHWDGRDRRGMEVASGVYLYRLETGRICLNRRMTLVR